MDATFSDGLTTSSLCRRPRVPLYEGSVADEWVSVILRGRDIEFFHPVRGETIAVKSPQLRLTEKDKKPIPDIVAIFGNRIRQRNSKLP